MRVALAATLFAEPDLLLLDEPTNYLDLEATLWLEEHIARYPRTVIVISHDRDLLDNAVDWILHLEAGKLALYRGGYTAFERQRRERQALDLKLAKKQEAQRKRLQAFVDRFRAKATKARQAQSRLKLLAKLEPVAAVIADEVRPIEIPPPAKPLSPPIIALDDVAVGYEPGRPVLRRLYAAHRRRRSHRAARRQRQRQIDAGEAPCRAARADVGTAHARAKARRRLFRPAPARRARPERRRLRPSAPADARRARGQGARARRRHRVSGSAGGHAGRRSSPAARRRGCCSGLRPSRARISSILDEPTNHLDIDSRAALIDGDQRLSRRGDPGVARPPSDRGLRRSALAGRRRPGRRLRWRPRRLPEAACWPNGRATAKDNGGRKDEAAPRAGRADARRAAAEKRIELAPLRRRITEAEAVVARLNAEIARIDAALAEPGLFARDPAKAAALAKARADHAAALAKAEEDWLEASAELEAAGSR